MLSCESLDKNGHLPFLLLSYLLQFSKSLISTMPYIFFHPFYNNQYIPFYPINFSCFPVQQLRTQVLSFDIITPLHHYLIQLFVINVSSPSLFQISGNLLQFLFHFLVHFKVSTMVNFYLAYFQKMKVGLSNRQPVYVCVSCNRSNQIHYSYVINYIVTCVRFPWLWR
jgi:hypothetical protein